MALLFFKGSLLRDLGGLLATPRPNSRVGRRMEFSGLDQVIEQEDRVRALLVESLTPGRQRQYLLHITGAFGGTDACGD